MTRILLVRAGHGNELLDEFIRLGVVAVGWGKLGDLSFTSADTIKTMLCEQYPEGMKVSGEPYKHLAEIIHFAVEAKIGDLVATVDGKHNTLIVGAIGPYKYNPVNPLRSGEELYRHVRLVTWEFSVDREIDGPHSFPETKQLGKSTYWLSEQTTESIMGANRKSLAAYSSLISSNVIPALQNMSATPVNKDSETLPNSEHFERAEQANPIPRKLKSIDLNQIKAAFDFAEKVYDGVSSIEHAAVRLRDDHGLNENSARNFLLQYRCMLNGEVYKRTQSPLALSYFLPKIHETRGREAAENAIAATWMHIAYYEQLRKTLLLKLRKVLTTFENGLSGHMSQQVHEAKFAAAVGESLRTIRSVRQARLAKASKMANVIQVTTKLYQRNPDVVAEVLFRANGFCEICHQPAPFNRRCDGSPYIEVHHKIHLAQGGDDTVENAIAACPNCHRKAHFG